MQYATRDESMKEVRIMAPEHDDEKVPIGQAIFDDLFLFFMLSLVISFVIYNVWGLLDLLSTPLLP
jgi:hypothetical protein